MRKFGEKRRTLSVLKVNNAVATKAEGIATEAPLMSDRILKPSCLRKTCLSSSFSSTLNDGSPSVVEAARRAVWRSIVSRNEKGGANRTSILPSLS